MKVAAIDFETANYDRTSPCAVGLVAVENSKIVDRIYKLISPPTRFFYFTYLHGISREDAADVLDLS